MKHPDERPGIEFRSASKGDGFATFIHWDMAVTDANDPIPPHVGASVTDVRPLDGEEQVPWWRPSWRDAMRHLGWRWVLIVLAIALLGIAIAPFVVPGWRRFAYMSGEIKLAKWVVILAIYLIGHTWRSAVKVRREPFCIHCGYNLTGLPNHHRCPECGRGFSWAVIDEYRRDPDAFIARYEALKRLPQADAAFAAGLVPRRRRARDGTE